MTEELDPTGGGVDTSKIVTVVAGVTALVTVVLNWLRGRREGQEKAEAVMIERYKQMVADLVKAGDSAKAEYAKAFEAAKVEYAKAADLLKSEHTTYKVETTKQIAELNDKVAVLVSQVHYLQLYLAQNGVKTPPKWDRRSDSALFLNLDDETKESKP